MQSKSKPLIKNILFFAKIIGIAIFIAICLRIFVFDSFKIPSQSMAPAIEAGDFILVNKLILGPRFYRNFDFLKGGKVETTRLWGFREVKRNDVLVFNFPYSERKKLGFDLNAFYVKRCVALPGDTFCIENSIYKVKGCDDTLGNYKIQQKFATMDEKNIPPDVFQCFPKRTKFYYWTMKNFGPLYVPRKNDCLSIDSINIALYKNLIEYETEKKIKITNGTIYLNDSVILQYAFSKNYYFMAGDNILDSRDSRYWGLLPESHIVGKAAVIWKSEDINTGEYKWKRFFKGI